MHAVLQERLTLGDVTRSWLGTFCHGPGMPVNNFVIIFKEITFQGMIS